MRLNSKFKIALIVALGVMLFASIAGAAVFALTLVQDTTEDTPVAVVGETAGAAGAAVVAVGEAAPDSPIEPEAASANETPEVPDAPTSVSATLDSCSSGPSCSVTLSWAAATTGNAATGYSAAIMLSDGSGTPVNSGNLSASTLSHTFTVTAYGKYTAQVHAENENGSSDWAGDVVTVALVPSAIASVSISRDTGSLSLSWTVPHDGGSALLRYEAECSTNNGTSWKSCDSDIKPSGAEGSTFTTTIADVDAALPYKVRVRAVNDIGNGAWTESAQVAQISKPGEATNIEVTRDGFDISATWTAAPLADTYNVWLWKETTGNPQVLQTKTGVTDTSIEFEITEFDDSHQVAIMAKNDYGEGALRSSSVIHPPSPPALTESVTGARSRDGATITAAWTAVEGATHYHLNYTADGGTTWLRYASDIPASNTSLAMVSLQKKKKYIIAVQSVTTYQGTNVTKSLAKGWTDSGAIHAPPGKPTGVSGAKGSQQVTVSWTIPSFRGTGPNGAANKISYAIYCRANDYTKWVKVVSNLTSYYGVLNPQYTVTNANCWTNRVAVTATNVVEGDLGTN